MKLKVLRSLCPSNLGFEEVLVLVSRSWKLDQESRREEAGIGLLIISEPRGVPDAITKKPSSPESLIVSGGNSFQCTRPPILTPFA